MAEKQTVAVVGASNNPSKFGNKAVRAYLRDGWDVYPVNPHEETVEGLRVYASVEDVPVHLNRVSMYVPASVGVTLLDGIAASGADELWVNPGAGSPELLAKARELGMEPIQACSILALGRDSSRRG